VYGIRSPSINSPYVKKIEDLLDIWARINAFGATPPVDIFPFLQYVPQSVFGNWRDRVKRVHDEMHMLYDNLREAVIERRTVKGKSANSILDRLLNDQEKEGLTEHQITLLAGVTTKGGSDTSASVLASFVQAMITWPEVQKKAQAEIDSVIGEDRVPDFSDYVNLPYVAAIIKEAHRWRPVAPLSVPHATSQGM
jgi:cytochrome P450